jgi:hypothetical protein
MNRCFVNNCAKIDGILGFILKHCRIERFRNSERKGFKLRSAGGSIGGANQKDSNCGVLDADVEDEPWANVNSQGRFLSART